MSPTEDKNAFFSSSPFALTADAESAKCWAGRREILGKLERLCRSFAQRSDSSLDMIWANLGAGKSHALMHTVHLLQGHAETGRVLPVYTELPKQTKHFLDLYRRMVGELPLDALAPTILECRGHAIPADLQLAARAIAYGGPQERDLAKDWLLATRPYLRDLKNATGITARIEDDLKACDILSGLISALSDKRVRLVVLLDEFQRLSLSPQRQRDAVLSNLRSIFSRNSAFFSMVLAVASKVEKNALSLLPQELRTLMGMKPAVSLPELNEPEAMEFVLERFKFFRPPGYTGAPVAPFGETTVREILSFMLTGPRARLTPRNVLQTLAWVYDSATIRRDGTIDPEEARALLEELRWDEDAAEPVNK